MSILKFLGIEKPDESSTGDTETVRKIVDSLDQLPSERARYIASFAYILSRVANADSIISAEETRAMEKIITEVAGLPEEQAVLVVQIAKTQNKLFGATEDFLVTREFARIATREQKLQVLRSLFAVSAAEDMISLSEDNAIRQIASEIGLDHRDFIAERLSYRDQLSILQDLPGVPERTDAAPDDKEP